MIKGQDLICEDRLEKLNPYGLIFESEMGRAYPVFKYLMCGRIERNYINAGG